MNIVQLSPTDDLTKILEHAVPNTKYVGAKGITYKVIGSPTVSAANVAVSAAGVVVTPANGATTGISVRGANFEWAVNECFSTQAGVNFILAYAPGLNVHDCMNVHDVDDFLFLDRSSPAAGADNASVMNCMGAANVTGYLIYSTCDNGKFTNLTAMGSVGQQNYRLDVNANGHIPQNNAFSNCQGNNWPHNGLDKETFSDRQGFGTTYNDCVINGWAYAGQAAAQQAGQFATLTYNNCTFNLLRSVGSQLQLGHGVTAVVKGCTFITDAAQVNISTSPTSTLTATNNIRKCKPGVVPGKSFIANLGGVVNEVGTVVQN